MRGKLISASKFLSLVLRHKPETIGLRLDGQGWADISELLEKAKNSYRLTRDDLLEIVATNEKKRFALNDDGTKIRASQGHSVKVDLDLRPSIPPPVLYHGTADRFLDSIKRDGLIKMNRNHVHLSKNRETAISVGSRHGRVVVLEIDSKQMQNDGYSFYLSDNGVWLTEHVPERYIKFL